MPGDLRGPELSLKLSDSTLWLTETIFSAMPALDYIMIEYGAYIWSTVYQREDHVFYKSASREVEGAVLLVPWCLIFSPLVATPWAREKKCDSKPW